jgi:hypothetical protein
MNDLFRRMKSGRRLVGGLMAMGAMLATPAASFAGARANLVGTVIDSVGKPVAGIEIQILNDEGKPVAAAISTERGRYKIRCLEEGSYGIRLVPKDHHVLGRTSTVKVTAEGRRLDWTVDEERPALPRPLGTGGKCSRTAFAHADALTPLLPVLG